MSCTGVWKSISAEGAPGPSPEARALGVGWGDIEAGTDHAGLVDLMLTLAFTLRDVEVTGEGELVGWALFEGLHLFPQAQYTGGETKTQRS